MVRIGMCMCVVFVLCSLVSCGGGMYTCMTDSSVGTTHGTANYTFCIEYTGLTADQVNLYEKQCAGTPQPTPATTVNFKGTWSQKPCERTNTLGACRIASGGFSYTIWYYQSAGMQKDTAKSTCTTYARGTWIDS